MSIENAENKLGVPIRVNPHMEFEWRAIKLDGIVYMSQTTFDRLVAANDQQLYHFLQALEVLDLGTSQVISSKDYEAVARKLLEGYNTKGTQTGRQIP